MKILAFFKAIFSSFKFLLFSALFALILFFLVNNREFVMVDFKPIFNEPIAIRAFILIISSYILGVLSSIILASSGFLKRKILRLRKK